VALVVCDHFYFNYGTIFMEKPFRNRKLGSRNVCIFSGGAYRSECSYNDSAIGGYCWLDSVVVSYTMPQKMTSNRLFESGSSFSNGLPSSFYFPVLILIICKHF
jgi:hypothetical protein